MASTINLVPSVIITVLASKVSVVQSMIITVVELHWLPRLV